MIAAKELCWRQCSLRLKEPCAVYMPRKPVPLHYILSHTLHYRQTVGTGFIGYAQCKDEYISVLVTANHVIPTVEDGRASRIIFENVLSDNRKLTLKGFQIFTGDFWSSPMKEV